MSDDFAITMRSSEDNRFVLTTNEPARILVTLESGRVLIDRIGMLVELSVANEFAEVVMGPMVVRNPTGRQEIRLLVDPVYDER